MHTKMKMFGPTNSVADTLTPLAPTTGWTVPYDLTITKLRISKSNIVNAKECSGFIHVDVIGDKGKRYAFAYGGGTGGATNAGPPQMPADTIKVSIPCPKSSNVIISALDAEAAVSVRVNVMYSDGLSADILTLAAGGAGQDVTAGTELTLSANSKLSGVNMNVTRNGRIISIRAAGAGIVDALNQGFKLNFDIPPLTNEYEAVFYGGPGGAATSGPCPTDYIGDFDEPLDIPVSQGTTITCKLLNVATSGAAIQSASVSIIIV